MNHPTDARDLRTETASEPLSPLGARTDRAAVAGDTGSAECTGGDLLRDVNRIAETMNRDPRFLASAAQSPETTLVLVATDTGREIMITLNGQGLSAHLWAGQPFDVKIEAAEEVHWAILSGKMDADAAFFTGKVRIRGSIATAFRVKNRFLSLLQWHFARGV